MGGVIPTRQHILLGMCYLHGFRKGAELGVSTGKTTLFLMGMLPKLEMICVDLWAPQAPRDSAGAETYEGWKHNGHYEGFKDSTNKYYPGRVTIYRESTFTAHEHVEDDSLDFVFIDADHTYEACLKDIQNWTPKVRAGGMISGHDYDPIVWPGVVKAVDETGGATRLTDHVWVRVKE